MKKVILPTLLSLFLFSCSEEIENIPESYQTNNAMLSKSVPMIEDRLYFNSAEEFTNLHITLSEDSKKFDEYKKQLFSEGFLSPESPIEENEELAKDYLNNVYSFLEKNVNQKELDKPLNPENLADYADHAEEVIIDDVFRALLNLKGEIQIANEIYKYTDNGLFVVNANNYRSLDAYLKKERISNILLIPTKKEVTVSRIDKVYANVKRLGVDNLTPSKFRWQHEGDIKIFLPYDPKYSSNQAVAYKATTGEALQTDPNYEAWIQTLQNCAPRNTVYERFISNLFGDRDMCIDNYKSRRRVKTKAWNMDYGLFYSTGAVVKHQKGIKVLFATAWVAEKVSEMKFIVEAVQYEYNISVPSNITDNFGNYKEQKTFYSNWGWAYDYNPTLNYFDVRTFSINNLPKIFHADLTFEWFETGWSALDLSVQNGFDAAKLNDFFWKGAWTTTQSILSSMPDKFNVNSPNRTAAFKFPKESVIIVQKSQIKSSTNDNKLKTTFDYGGGINLSFGNSGGGSSWNISGGAMSGLIKPKNFKIKFIGAAKTSMGWRGSKISSI